MSKSLADKERELKERISKARQQLTTLQKKQKLEIGALAFKHGLNEFDTKTLDKEFKKLAAQLNG